jgi:3-methylcrotonyl-CoA carboxylase alpha subunit
VTPDNRVVALGDGRFELVSRDRRQLAYAVQHGDATWVFIDGSVHVIEPAGARVSRRVRGHDDAALSAPMPATVIALTASPGQSVKAGDVLVTLEAMKMELAITAPRDGRVRAVHCRAGELVQPGVPLLELDGAT